MSFTDKKTADFRVLLMGMMLADRFLMRVIGPAKVLVSFAPGIILMCIIIVHALGWPLYSLCL